jgi:hypothetical protein
LACIGLGEPESLYEEWELVPALDFDIDIHFKYERYDLSFIVGLANGVGDKGQCELGGDYYGSTSTALFSLLMLFLILVPVAFILGLISFIQYLRGRLSQRMVTFWRRFVRIIAGYAILGVIYFLGTFSGLIYPVTCTDQSYRDVCVELEVLLYVAWGFPICIVIVLIWYLLANTASQSDR